jgi:alkanesulfonate monooxygenase SsuD/methylene tetrahydromethanopterin reductase-like flavin-dependent oxidoreductase (luciferase family)
VERAARLGLPLALAIIGGMPERFAPLVRYYRDAWRQAGHDPAKLQVSINSHGFIAEDSRQAAEVFYPGYEEVMNRIGRERGWPPTNRAQFEAQCAPRGALLVGSPDEVVEKILFEHELFGHTRFLLQTALGPIPHDRLMRSIELLGTRVAPAVRKALG